jgi:arsenite methyltransferase
VPDLSAAHWRALPLLASEPPPPTGGHGYVDLLTEPPRATNWAQALWLGRLGSGLYAALQPAGARMARLHGDPAARLGLSRGDTVLDLGCGPGGITRRLADAVGEEGLVVGVDISDEMLARAPSAENIAYYRGDAMRLPFRDGRFDAVCCSALLQLLTDPFAALDRMIDLLAPGGRIAILTTCRGRGAKRPLTTLVRSLSGVRVFEQHEIPAALHARGMTGVRQNFVAIFQLVTAHKEQEVGG